MTTRLTGGWVVAWDAERGAHEVLEGGCVVYEGERVVFTGFPDDPACPDPDEDLTLPGRLVSPGLINLHCIANIDLQPLRIDVTEVGFPKSRAWFERGDEVLSDAQLRLSARFSVAALLRSGSTTFCNVTTMASKRFDDPVAEPRALADAAEELGARAWLAHNFQDHSRWDGEDGRTHVEHDPAQGERGLARALELLGELGDYGDRVQGFLFPYTTQTCSDALFERAVAAARERGVPIRSHFAQYPGEALASLEARGESPVERMDRLGALGSDLTLTHAIFLRGHPQVGRGTMDRDLELLAGSGTHVAHCPVVFSRRGVLLRSFDRYRNAGINLALGTDTAPPDMPGEMRMAATMAKVAEGDAGAGSAAAVFEAATVGGARALGRVDLGRLAPGASADLAVFDLRGLHLGVIDDPIKALVHYASAGDAERVVVAGRTVVEGRALVGVDEPALLAEAQEVWGDYREALAARDPQGRSADALYPPALPVRRAP